MRVHIINEAFRRKVAKKAQHIISIETFIYCYSVCFVERIYARMNVLASFYDHLHLPCWTLLSSNVHNILHTAKVAFFL